MVPAALPTSPLELKVVDVEPGALRELHWHPNAAEWQYYVSDRGRMGVFAAEGRARTFGVAAGDVGYVPFAMGHYVENTGDEPLRFLEIFRSERFADISLAQWRSRSRRRRSCGSTSASATARCAPCGARSGPWCDEAAAGVR